MSVAEDAGSSFNGNHEFRGIQIGSGAKAHLGNAHYDYTLEGPHFGTTVHADGPLVQSNYSINGNGVERPDFTGNYSHSSLAPVKAFVPRPLLRDQIRSQLCDGPSTGTTRTLAVWGLGGMGKTQLVLDYLQHYSKQYQAAFWIEAGRNESLERDCIDLYQVLYSMHTMPTLVRAEPVSMEQAVLGIKSWFSGRQGPWLMVFDGADNVEDRDAANFIDIKHFIPDVPSLHFIIATRSGMVNDMTQLDGVYVGELEETQAVELFYRYSKLRRDDLSIAAEVEKIVQELGCLALAVTLAGAYVGSSRRLQYNITAYIPEFSRKRGELLNQKADVLVHQYGEAVCTTWETSYSAIQQQCPEAAILLTILSFMHYEDIFPQLLHTAENSEKDACAGQWTSIIFSRQAIDMDQIDFWLGILEKYSFVKWNDHTRSYTIHKLVHAWGYERLSPDEKEKYSYGVLKLIVTASRRYGQGPADRLRLVPHIMANFTAVILVNNNLSHDSFERVDEVGELAVFLDGLGLWPEKRTMVEFVTDTRLCILGNDHLDTILAMHNLAITLCQSGENKEALQITREVLGKTRSVIGDNHPDTLGAVYPVELTLDAQGQTDEASQKRLEVLEESKGAVGASHPDTGILLAEKTRQKSSPSELDLHEDNLQMKEKRISIFARAKRKFIRSRA